MLLSRLQAVCETKFSWPVHRPMSILLVVTTASDARLVVISQCTSEGFSWCQDAAGVGYCNYCYVGPFNVNCCRANPADDSIDSAYVCGNTGNATSDTCFSTCSFDELETAETR
jgi:hypothetical protein